MCEPFAFPRAALTFVHVPPIRSCVRRRPCDNSRHHDGPQTNHRRTNCRGRPIDAARLERGQGTREARTARAGEATLRRGIFLRSLVSSEGSERPDILGRLLHRKGVEFTGSDLGRLLTGPLPTAEERGQADFVRRADRFKFAGEMVSEFGHEGVEAGGEG